MNLPLYLLILTGNRHFGPPPPWFDRNHPLMPKLDHDQIEWWDECHIEQQGGKVGNKMVQYSFKRDKEGNLSKTGEYTNELLNRTLFNFPEQGRFSFGVAKVRKVGSDSSEGVRIKEVNYTRKNIVTIDVYEGHVKTELNRAKNLVSDKNSHG